MSMVSKITNFDLQPRYTIRRISKHNPALQNVFLQATIIPLNKLSHYDFATMSIIC